MTANNTRRGVFATKDIKNAQILIVEKPIAQIYSELNLTGLNPEDVHDHYQFDKE